MNNNMGERIKLLREKANLSRSQFAEKYGISSSTLRSYEIGVQPIPEIKYVFFETIFKNLGFELDFNSPDKLNTLGEGIISTVSFDKGDLTIKREIDFFKAQNPDYLLYTISNNFMYPLFNIGDIVGGIKYFTKEAFLKFSGGICIVMDKDNEKFIGRVLNVNNYNVFISPHNHAEASNLPLMEIKNVSAIAQVTRHWCLNNMIRP